MNPRMPIHIPSLHYPEEQKTQPKLTFRAIPVNVKRTIKYDNFFNEQFQQRQSREIPKETAQSPLIEKEVVIARPKNLLPDEW